MCGAPTWMVRKARPPAKPLACCGGSCYCVPMQSIEVWDVKVGSVDAVPVRCEGVDALKQHLFTCLVEAGFGFAHVVNVVTGFAQAAYLDEAGNVAVYDFGGGHGVAAN